MKLILHIGGHKTGTTSIQMAMAKSYGALLKSGLCYPRSLSELPCHHPVAFAVLGTHGGFAGAKAGYELDDYLDAIFAEAATVGAQTVLLSSEQFMALSREQVCKLADSLKRFSEVKVLAYIRNQVDLFESSYKFSVLWDVTRETTDFASFLQERVSSPYHEFDARLSPWNSVHANTRLVVKSFRDEVSRGLINGFLEEANINNYEMRHAEYERENQSLSRMGTLILRKSNRCNESGRDKLISKIREMERDGSLDRSGRLYTAGQINELVARYYESNVRLYEDYGIDLNAEMCDASQRLCLGDAFKS